MPAGMQALGGDLGGRVSSRRPRCCPARRIWSSTTSSGGFSRSSSKRTLWSDRSLFLLLSAGAMGIVAVVMWDTLFPDRRDVFALGPLPVESRVQSAGRLGGLLTLFGLFAVASERHAGTALSARVGEATSSASSAGRSDMSIAALAADAFVFFGLTSVQGVLIVVTSRRAAERLAPIIQTGAVLVLLVGLLFFAPLRTATTRALAGGDLADPILRWCPLAWFVGLYETIGGTSRPVMHALAVRGLLAGIVPVAATIALYILAFRRLCARAIETPARSTSSGLSTAVSAVVRLTFVRHPVEQASAPLRSAC